MTTGKVINRDWTTKVLLGVIAVCLVGICAWHLFGPSRIELREMIIVDDAGNKRIALSVGEKGPAIYFFDEDSKPRIELILQNRKPSSVPSLSLLDLDGGRTVTLDSISGGSAGESSSALILRGPKGAMVSLGASKVPELRLSGRGSGGASAHLTCFPGLGGVLTMFDRNDTIRFNLGTNREGAARLEVFDSEEKVLWKAP